MKLVLKNCLTSIEGCELTFAPNQVYSIYKSVIKKVFTQLQCHIIFFAYIYCIVNFDWIFLQLNTSRFQGNFDVIFEFLESKIIARRIFKARGFFKQRLSKNFLHLVPSPLITVNLSFFENAMNSDPLGVRGFLGLVKISKKSMR